MASAPYRSLLAARDAEPEVLREADSQVGYKGDLVVLDSAKRVRFLAPADTNTYDSTTQVGGSIAGKVYGRAMQNGSNATIATTPAFNTERLESISQFYLPVWSATPANAEYQDVNVGDSFALIRVGNVLCVNLDVTANPVVTVVSKAPGLDPTARYEQVVLKLIDAQRAQ